MKVILINLKVSDKVTIIFRFNSTWRKYFTEGYERGISKSAMKSWKGCAIQYSIYGNCIFLFPVLTAKNVRHHPQKTTSGTCRMEISLACRCPSTGLTGARETAKTAQHDCISLKMSKIIQFYYWGRGEGKKAINYWLAQNHVWKHLK